MNLHSSNIDSRSSANSHVSNPSSVFSRYFPLSESTPPSQYQPSPSLSNQQPSSTYAMIDPQHSPIASHNEITSTQISQSNDPNEATSIGMDSQSSINSSISYLSGCLKASTMPDTDSRGTRPLAIEFFTPMDDAAFLGRSNYPSHSNSNNIINSSGSQHVSYRRGNVANHNRNKRRNKKIKKKAAATSTQP